MSQSIDVHHQTALAQVAKRNPGAGHEPYGPAKAVKHACRQCKAKTPHLRFHTVDGRGDLDAWHKCMTCGSMRAIALPTSGDTLQVIERIQQAA